MGRGLRIVLVASVLLVSAALAGLVIWYFSPRSIRYGVGALMVAVGTGFTILHLTVRDEYLDRHFGEPAASRMRQLWRTGWVGVLIGAAMIAAEHFLGTGR